MVDFIRPLLKLLLAQLVLILASNECLLFLPYGLDHLLHQIESLLQLSALQLVLGNF